MARAITGQEGLGASEYGECFIEIGDGKAGWGGGNFYAEPTPQVTLWMPRWRWHFSKVPFEKSWLYTRLS